MRIDLIAIKVSIFTTVLMSVSQHGTGSINTAQNNRKRNRSHGRPSGQALTRQLSKNMVCGPRFFNLVNAICPHDRTTSVIIPEVPCCTNCSPQTISRHCKRWTMPKRPQLEFRHSQASSEQEVASLLLSLLSKAPESTISFIGSSLLQVLVEPSHRYKNSYFDGPMPGPITQTTPRSRAHNYHHHHKPHSGTTRVYRRSTSTRRHRRGLNSSSVPSEAAQKGLQTNTTGTANIYDTLLPSTYKRRI